MRDFIPAGQDPRAFGIDPQGGRRDFIPGGPEPEIDLHAVPAPGESAPGLKEPELIIYPGDGSYPGGQRAPDEPVGVEGWQAEAGEPGQARLKPEVAHERQEAREEAAVEAAAEAAPEPPPPEPAPPEPHPLDLKGISGTSMPPEWEKFAKEAGWGPPGPPEQKEDAETETPEPSAESGTKGGEARKSGRKRHA